MNISTEMHDMLCGWLACVEMNPNETPAQWAARGLSMRVDKDIVLIEIPRAEHEECCKQMTKSFTDFVKKLSGASNEKPN